MCNRSANKLKKVKVRDLNFNNAGLDEQEKAVEKGETIDLASTFGGTSID
jgi:hypothetical protein